MLFELISIGIFIGILSGFFGIGGGIILVPTLVSIGINIKDAINISIIQMIFSSIFGSYLNYLNQKFIFKDILYIGLGGFIGGHFGYILLEYISENILYIIYIIILIYSIIKLYLHKIDNLEKKLKMNSSILRIFIGVPIGIFSNILGIGGSILLVPILITIFNYTIKQATNLGLFFVIFSSVSGGLSQYFSNNINLEYSLPVAFASIFGVFIGIKIKQFIDIKFFKYILLILYLLTLFLAFQSFLK